jgi:clan AA aspartic protease (TIGR02281 family)
MFFFVKKNKKTFAYAVADSAGKGRGSARKSFLLLFYKKEGLSLLLSFALTACQADQQPCRLGYATEVPLRHAHGNIFATTYLNDQPTNMIFDTGAAETLLNKTTASRLALELVRLPGYQVGIGGIQRSYGFTARSYRIGRLSGKNFFLRASDLGIGGGGTSVDGLLGDDFFAAYDVDLDLWRGRAVLYKPLTNGCTKPTTALDGDLYVVPMEWPTNINDHEPRIRVRIDGKSLIAIVDSGSGGTAIFRDSARRIGLDINRLTADKSFPVQGIGPGAVRAVRHVMAPIEFGGLTIHPMPVAILDQHSLPDADMLLGLDFLSRVHAWFSFSSRTLILELPPAAGTAKSPQPG